MTVSFDGAIDQAELSTQIKRVASEIERPPRDAVLRLGASGTVEDVVGQAGLAVDAPASRALIIKALSDGKPAVDLVVREVPPAISDELVQPARETLRRVFGDGGSAPLTLTFGQQSWPLSRDEVTRAESWSGRLLADRPGSRSRRRTGQSMQRAMNRAGCN